MDGLRKVGFRASNIKLFRLADGTLVCVYRDEEPARHCQLLTSCDAGESWQFAGQLYSDRAARHQPGMCGYPDMVSLGVAAVPPTPRAEQTSSSRPPDRTAAEPG